jgi:RNA polymerase-interacting CarD/CdnL/TRCF family regulator
METMAITENERRKEEAARLRKEAAECYRNGDLQKAADLWTKIIEADQNDEKSYANRSAAMLEL